MRTHSIRLAGPWQYQVVAEDNLQAAILHSGDLRLPFPSSFPDALMPRMKHSSSEPTPLVVRLQRRFHRPTGLTLATQVWLRLVMDQAATCLLNQQPLTPDQQPDPFGSNAGQGDCFSCEITRQLRDFNVLEIHVRLMSGEVPNTVTQVTLEIAEPSESLSG
jgi:hypothetical protein